MWSRKDVSDIKKHLFLKRPSTYKKNIYVSFNVAKSPDTAIFFCREKCFKISHRENHEITLQLSQGSNLSIEKYVFIPSQGYVCAVTD